MSHLKNGLKLSALLLFGFLISTTSYAQSYNEIEEIIVKGKVLYSDQVQALRTPVPISDVPQTLSIVTDEEIRTQGFRGLTLHKVKGTEIQLYSEVLDQQLTFMLTD